MDANKRSAVSHLFGRVMATIVAPPLSELRLTMPTVSDEFYRTSRMGRISGRGRGRPSETK